MRLLILILLFPCITVAQSIDFPAVQDSSDVFKAATRLQGTIGVQLPGGTTAQRPKTFSLTNFIRWNSDSSRYETYISGWKSIAWKSDIITPSDEAYDATTWNGSLGVPTKNAIRDKIESMGGLGYSVYTALLSQSSTSDPTATVLGSNTIGSIVWARTGTGSYTATLTGAFTSNKTWLICQKGDANGSFVNGLLSRTSADVLHLDTRDNVNTLADGFTNLSIEIRVYP